MRKTSDYNPSQSLLIRRRLLGTMLIFILHSSLFTLHSFAQISSTLSPYSRFGVGLRSDQSQGFNRSMGGVGVGVRTGSNINTTNPASYSAIDSMSLILDVGMKATFGRMKQDGTHAGVKGASFEYAHIGMHIAKNLGLAAGFMPYTSIGYDFASPDITFAYDANTTLPITGSSYYSGSGGLNQAYIGLGWKVYRNLSVGINGSFLWGQYNHALLQQFKEGTTSSNSYKTIAKAYLATLRTYNIDLGAQYSVRLTKQDWLNLGATLGIGHKIAQDAYITNGDTLGTAYSPFDLPFTFGIGASWQHKNTLMVAADVRHEHWGSCRIPIETAEGYLPMKGYYKSMTKVAVGAQWTPAPFDKSYWKRIQYRAGFNCTTPYLKVNGHNGPSEISLTVGAGLPISNRINNRSVINAGLQWLRRSSCTTGMVTENYFLINLGLTFNERWFMKYKIE